MRSLKFWEMHILSPYQDSRLALSDPYYVQTANLEGLFQRAGGEIWARFWGEKNSDEGNRGRVNKLMNMNEFNLNS